MVRRSAQHALRLLAALIVALTASATAHAADPLTWVAPVKIDVGPGNKAIIRSVSCPTANLCVAAGSISNAGAQGAVILKTTTPRDPASWEVRTFPVTQLESAAVWCASDTACYLSGEAWPSGSSASRAPRRAVNSAPAGPLSGWTLESAAASSLTCASEALCFTSHFFPPPKNFFDDASVNGPFGGVFTQIPRPAAASQFPGYTFRCGRGASAGAAPCLGLKNTSWMVLPAGAASWSGGVRTELTSSFGAGSACTRSFCAVVPDSGVVNILNVGSGGWTVTAGESGLGSPDVACAEDADGAARCIVNTGDFSTFKSGFLESPQPTSAVPGDWNVTYGVFGALNTDNDAVGLGCATSRTCVAFSFDGRVTAGIAPEAPSQTPAPTPTPAPGAPTSEGTPAPTPTPPVPAPGSVRFTLATRTATVAPNGNTLFDIVVDAFASIGLQGALIQKATKGVGTGAAVRSAAPKRPAAKPLLTGTGKAGADGKARVTGTLSKSGRALLRKRGKLRLRLTITVTTTAGTTATSTADVTIRAAKKKKG